MGWLERYATRRRVTALVWSCVIMLVDSWLIARRQPWTYFEFAQMWIAILLTLNLTFEAATLFRQERHNGVLELLLVTPLSVDRLVIARLSSFWKRFFPPVALALGLSTLMIWLDLAQPPNWNFRIFLGMNYVTIPVIGFWLALRFRSFTGALVVLLAFGFGLPVLLPQMAGQFLLQLSGLEWPWFFYALGVSDSAPHFPIT